MKKVKVDIALLHKMLRHQQTAARLAHQDDVALLADVLIDMICEFPEKTEKITIKLCRHD